MPNEIPLKPLSAVECIRPAVNRTETSLFHPLRWARWWRLALLGLATGEAASQGGCNFNLPGGGDWSKIGKAGGGTGTHSGKLTFPHIPGISSAQIALLVTVLVVGIIVLVFVHLYVSSVARFMLLDAVATGRQRLREGWNRWHSHGFRYFLFQLVLGAVSLIFTVVLFGIPALIAWKMGMFQNFKDHWVPVVVGLIILAPIFIVFSVAISIFGLFAKDFAVPVIALEDITIPGALRKVWAMVKAAKGNYAIYVLMKIAIAIVVGIGLAIIYFIVALVIIVPMVIIFVAAGIASPAMFQNPLTIALLVTLVFLAIIPLLFLVGLVATPAVVFYQSYVLNFFGSRYAPLWAFMHPEGVPNLTPPAAPMPGGHEPPPYNIVPPEPTG